MHTIQFKCELLTDLVIISNAATEGFHRSLDYIPGAKFLGIVANKCYKEKEGKYQGDTSLIDLFHSNAVQFRDAYPCVNGERILPTPRTWMQPKQKQAGCIYQHHNLEDTDRAGFQPKKIDEPYFLPSSKELVKVEQDFSIKSAYDMELRRSKESAMYGYFALERGTTWCFSVRMENSDYAEKIKTALVGKRRIGRSKSAEYGLVKISEGSYTTNYKNKTDSSDTVYLYAASNWCFYKKGICTANPDLKDLFPNSGLEADDKNYIAWQKSTVRTRPYRTWNAHRKNRDTDRLIIEKGSVLTLKIASEQQAALKIAIEKGIGAHRNEGMGVVLVNPDFLTEEKSFVIPSESIMLEKTKKHYVVTKGDAAQEELLFACLENRAAAAKEEIEIANAVQKLVNSKDFKQTFQKITTSQWGVIRRKARQADSPEVLDRWLFDEKIGYLKTGQTKAMWEANNRAKKLREILFGTDEDSKKSKKYKATTLAIKIAKEASIKSETA